MNPSDQNDAIVVFTARSPERIIREGGSQAWVLNPVRAKQCRWLICTQNRHNPDHEFSDATEPHRTGFLLGRISGLRKSEEGDGDRWQILISEFARIQLPDAWDHGRNPVRYTSLRKIGVDPDGMMFEHIPPVHAAGKPSNEQSQTQTSPATMLAEAKRTLAAAFGVKPEAVEITIRG
jgi:hypothetical protein